MGNQKGDWQSKLRRLGVVKGTRQLKPAPPPDPSLLKPIPEPTHHRDGVLGDSLDALLPGGQLVETAVGACYTFDKVYPLSNQHGDDHIGDLLAHSPAVAAVYDKDARLQDLNFLDFLFLDTETTGLAGAGTLAFMVGVAFFEKRRTDEYVLVVRQFFLRDHGDEAAMLTLLDDLLADKKGLVTFNGRSFDVPLLDGRFLMNRMLNPMEGLPHIDLLPPSRRLWRNRLDSCALSALEPALLGVHRTHEDVPGFLIPSMYHHYLRTGDIRDLIRVFYHNQIDMVSMVTLAARIMRLFAKPDESDDAVDLFSLGKWQADLGLAPEAEQNLRLALAGDLSLDYFHRALARLGLLLKRNGRRAEAVSIWQQMAATSFDTVDAHVELAKYFEWHAKEIEQAIFWTEQALSLANSWGRQGDLTRQELTHRLTRLQNKNKPKTDRF
ncbi:MAG: ribonuclease H-like domain-containing protein [Chloroflexi bacterium]|nr:ribonuclease H-like domain-containing protein [Chloroflexota bacterium]